MNTLEAKTCVDKLLSSSAGKKKYTPEEMIKMLQTSTRITLGDNDLIGATPVMGYINSNIKGVYYIIYCDSCNARCRKVYPTFLNINGNKVLKFLCNKCAGVKYERKKEYEKRALDILLHREKLQYLNPNNLSLKDGLAWIEAGFIEDKIRERASKNASRYMGIN